MDVSDQTWNEFIAQYPSYDSQSSPLEYDLSSKEVCGVPFITPFELRETEGSVILDNTTLLDGHIILGVSNGILELSKDLSTEPRMNSGHETLVSVAESVILHERLCVDGFVFANSPRARGVAALFGDIIQPICFSHKDRLALHDLIFKEYKNAIAKFDDITSGIEAFHDGKMIDRNHFSDWWRKYTSNNEINLTPPENEDLHIDLAMPVYLRNSNYHGYRTMYYLALSEFCSTSYKPHTSREVALSLLVEQSTLSPEDVVANFEKRLENNLQRLTARNTNHIKVLKLPIIFENVLSLIARGASFVDSVMEIRNSKNARGFRKWCVDLEQTMSQGIEGVQDTQKMLTELELVCDAWAEDIGDRFVSARRPFVITYSMFGFGVEFENFTKSNSLSGRHGLLFLNDLARSFSRNTNLTRYNRGVLSGF